MGRRPGPNGSCARNRQCVQRESSQVIGWLMRGAALDVVVVVMPMMMSSSPADAGYLTSQYIRPGGRQQVTLEGECPVLAACLLIQARVERNTAAKWSQSSHSRNDDYWHSTGAGAECRRSSSNTIWMLVGGDARCVTRCVTVVLGVAASHCLAICSLPCS